MSNEQELSRVFEDWLDRKDRGEAVDPTEWIARHPELEEELRARFDALALVDQAVAAAWAQPQATPQQLGEFRIVRELGRGGMGVVYEAEQVSLRRRVALKVLSPAAVFDPRHLKRFEAEAQAAAQLHHTNIVPVYSVGCDRGVHYYAMQYIEGRPLSRAIRELRDAPEEASSENALSPGTSTRTRSFFDAVARLGREVAEALHHAHEAGVVHRDVKPANILLDAKGKAWITDFGLAKLRQSPGLTVTGAVLGTVRYMSPEQALARQLNVDERTDVYSLGVTLYELATQRAAFEGDDMHQIMRRIATEEPRDPSRLNRAMPAELETIILKAIAKEPRERYQTAQELADDLQRFRDHKPIAAKRPTLIDRAVKWARRHRPLVGAAAGMLVLAVVGLAVGIVLVSREQSKTKGALTLARKNEQRAQDERRKATAALGLANKREKEAQDQRKLAEERENEAKRQKAAADEQVRIARAVREFLNEDLLRAVKPDRSGRDVTMRRALDVAARRVEGAFPDDPAVEAEVRRAIGEAYQGLGLYDLAFPHLTRSIDLLRQLHGNHDPKLAMEVVDLAWMYGNRRHVLGDKAVQAKQREIRLWFVGDSPGPVSASGKADHTDFEAILRKAREIQVQAHGAEHEDVITVDYVLGQVLKARGQRVPAGVLWSKTLTRARRVLGPNRILTLRIAIGLANLYRETRRPAVAREILEGALEAVKKGAGRHERRADREAEPVLVHAVMYHLGLAYWDLGQYEDSMTLAKEALARCRKHFGNEHWQTLKSMCDVANGHELLRNIAAAEPLRRESWEIKKKLLGETHHETLTCAERVARTWRLLGRTKAAIELHKWVIEQRLKTIGPDHLDLALGRHDLARAYLGNGEPEKAEPVLKAVLEVRRKKLGRFHGDTLEVHRDRIWVLIDQKKFKEAESYCANLINGTARTFPTGHEFICGAVAQLGAVYIAQGKYAAAERALRLVLKETLVDTKPPLFPTWEIAYAKSLLGEALARQKKFDEAEKVLLGAHEELKNGRPAPPRRMRESRARVAWLYDAWGKPDKAKAFKQ